MDNETRFARWLVASAPFRAADPLDYLARYQHGLLVQSRLREPKVEPEPVEPIKPVSNVLTLKGRKHG